MNGDSLAYWLTKSWYNRNDKIICLHNPPVTTGFWKFNNIKEFSLIPCNRNLVPLRHLSGSFCKVLPTATLQLVFFLFSSMKFLKILFKSLIIVLSPTTFPLLSGVCMLNCQTWISTETLATFQHVSWLFHPHFSLSTYVTSRET